MMDRARALRGMLAKLEDTCRTALRQFYMEDLSYREMARAQGVAVKTVGTRLSRCLQKLRAHIERDRALKELLGPALFSE